MKNLEIKVGIKEWSKLSHLSDLLREYYITDLHQKDTYFVVSNGRLKLREEDQHNHYTNEREQSTSHFIRYFRPDLGSEKISIYHKYDVPKDSNFFTVFDGVLKEEIVVTKYRALYLYKNARIHLDLLMGVPEDKSHYIEIEIVIKTEKEEKESKALLDELMDLMSIRDYPIIKKSYRELVYRGSPLDTMLKQEE